jgi:hypothetical protein
MTRDDIVRMAREAGGHASGFGDRWVMYTPDLERFAALVAAAEREACAALCEARFTGDLTREDMEAKRCAAAIRARGEA